MKSEPNYIDPQLTKQFAEQQYKTADNLRARQRLHEQFSTNQLGWYPWYLAQLDLPAQASILELGAGPASLWKAMHSRVPTGWKLHLTDFSFGMMQTAAQNLPLQAKMKSFTFAAADAQALPFPTACFDAVLANHMIYHIPDRQLGIREMRRVLKPGGKLYAATNGDHHMLDLDTLVKRLGPNLVDQLVMVSPSFASTFTMENGPDQLRSQFNQVETRRYTDNLEVTQAQPLVDYVFSMIRYSSVEIPPERKQAFLHAVENELKENGPIQIGKDAGVLIAQ